MLFGSSGIRKLFAQELLSLGPLVGAAVASNAKRVVLATDSRTSRNTLSDVILSGLISGGAEVLFGGIAPTPSVALAAGKADAGVMITASHNPENYNGYKLFRPDGSSYTVAQQEEIERRIAEPVYAAWDKQGFVSSVDIITPHKEKIFAEISVPESMTVVVDCGNGAGGQITPDVIGADGAKVIPVNCDPSGKFARPSEPLEKNLQHIPELIRKTGASCAVVNDGDADRMMAFDNLGRYVDGDQLLALFAKYLDAKQVVTTVDASMAIEEVAEELDALPKYTILRDAVMTPHGKEIMRVLGAENPTDGIRVTEENGWYLIRASGTEPKVRCTAEGRTKEDAKRMLEAGMSALKKAEKEVQ
ncbi:MAG: phosphoglucomutase [Methanocorpusculum sp.]|nr:phosphoglucomutase [Methanocorpusculum sp.]